MIFDLALSSIRLYTCYLLSKNQKSAWLISCSITLLKVFLLQAVDLIFLAYGKLFGLFVGLFAWQRWKRQDQNAQSSPSPLLKGSWIHECCIAVVVILFGLMCPRKSFHIQVYICAINYLAYLLAAFRKNECWILWIAYDVLLAHLFFSRGLFFSGLTTALYIPIALLGSQQWRLKAENKPNPVHVS